MFCGSKADFRRRMRAKSGRGGPQMLMLRLSAVGHQGREAEAFSEAQREKIREAASLRRWKETGFPESGTIAK